MFLEHWVATATTILTVASLAYFLLALWAARAYRHMRQRRQPSIYPPVSLLKPAKGVDPGMYKDLVSHCQQDYPAEYEIIFGVRSMDDPAVPVIQRLKEEFPNHNLRLVVCPETLGANGKVSTLVQMLPQARFDHLLINDSDVRVSPQYLRNVVRLFSSNGSPHPVGLVTALYRGRVHRSLGSRLESLGIATDFMPGVLMARWLEHGIHFGMGSTLAITRQALDAIGGLQPLVDHLGDDYEIGARISRAGFRVALAREVVETSVPSYHFRQFLDHQLRWARNLRNVRPAGNWGLVVTFGLPWALLNVAACRASIGSIVLLGLVLFARFWLALSVGVGILRDRRLLRSLWLLPLRDCVALGIWLWSFADNHVHWRGERFLLRQGKLTRAD
ncbi:MAG: bacteriohopanetetrol glucosamine biosynthesis glycosyltransferase HpnI [Acidobacteriaceae bacterium]